MNTPKKGPSTSKVAKTYKKTHKFETKHDGATRWDGMGLTRSAGSTGAKNTYKPKARMATYGGTKAGKGATMRRMGRSK